MNEVVGTNDGGRRERLRALIHSAQRQVSEASRDAGITATGRESSVSAARHRRQAEPGADIFAACLPNYQMLGEIHRGGQGVVYQAVQRSTQRRVAIKIMREGPFASAAERARFDREVQILAQLDHPNIVAIRDSGLAAGHYYLVMDYIAGVPPDRWIADGDPSRAVLGPVDRREDTPARMVHTRAESKIQNPKSKIDAALRLFIKICDAVNAAHLRGVIHRDLKPSNILVDAAGEPHVLDFGLAKMLDRAATNPSPDVNQDAHVSAVTHTGQFVGSLPWASPEQAGGACSDIDVRTDVYSLGVILYQMLTGRLPHDLRGSLRDVLERIVSAAPAPIRSAARYVDDELETIVLRCLQKDRERRYQNAGDVARDAQRYLAGEAIDAKRDSGWYVLRKTLRRYRRHVAVAATFVALVTVGSIALSILYARQGGLLTEVQQQRDKAVSAEQLADQRFQQANYESYVANIAAADAAIAASDGGAALARLQAAPPELRHWEWRYLVRQADQSVATWRGPDELIAWRVRLSPDERYIGAYFWMENREGLLRIWSHASQKAVAGLTFAAGAVSPFEFLASGDQVLFADRDSAISRLDLIRGGEVSPLRLATLPAGHSAMDLSPDGRIMLIGSKTGCFLWDVLAQRLLNEIPPPPNSWTAGYAFDAKASRFALGFGDGTVVLWDVVRGRELTRTKVHPVIVHGVALSPDGRLLATASGETGELALWELPPDGPAASNDPDTPALPLRMLREFRGGTQRVQRLSFSPDASLLATPCEDKTVRIWNVAEGELRTTLLGHTTGVVCTNFGRDGRFLVSGAREGVVKLWDLQRAPSVRSIRELPGPVNCAAFTAAGARLLLQCATAVCVVDGASGRWLHQRPLHVSSGFGAMLPGPGGSQTTFTDDDGSIRIWEIGSEEDSPAIGAHKSIPRLAADPSGRILASADAEAIVLWDWPAGCESRRFAGPGEPVHCLAISPDAARLALGLTSGELVLCDARTGQRTPVEPAHLDSIVSAAFSPDGRYLATGSGDRTVKLWDAASGRVLWSASPQLGDVWCVAFSPDGTRLAAGGRDRSVRIFDSQNGRELLALRGPTGTVMCVAFSPDGQSIAAGSWAREVFIWDAAEAR